MTTKSVNTSFERIIRGGKYVVLDTETTGLGPDDEIASIAVASADGTVLLDSLIRPTILIPAEATKVHGITNEMVADAPTWPQIKPRVIDAIAGNTVIVYNARYDTKMMAQSDRMSGLPASDYLHLSRYGCAMKWYAEIYGDWNDYRKSYRWQSLSDAVKQQALPVIDAHNALGDVLMTLALLKKLIAEIDRTEIVMTTENKE